MRIALLLPLLLCSHVLAQATRPAAPTQAQLEAEFAEKLTNATLVGSYTAGEDGRISEDRYTITSARKLFGDNWIIVSRIQYGQKDVTVPVPVTVKWAGDTPMIQLTDAGLPGLGKFTARVLFYGSQYAGTWSGAGHGGHIWGLESPDAAVTMTTWMRVRSGRLGGLGG
jgi:hypothetical protein